MKNKIVDFGLVRIFLNIRKNSDQFPDHFKSPQSGPDRKNSHRTNKSRNENPYNLPNSVLVRTFGTVWPSTLLIPFNSGNITDNLHYIEISVGRSFEDDETGEIQTESGTHLIVFSYETKCGDSSYSSDPAIINYYRQFFMRLDGESRDIKFGFRNL